MIIRLSVRELEMGHLSSTHPNSRDPDIAQHTSPIRTTMERIIYQPNGVSFDGTNDYLTRGADLTGNADSKLVTGSFWFRGATSPPATLQRVYESGTPRFAINRNSNETISIVGLSTAPALILSASTSAINDTNWHHVCFSFDMSDTGRRHIYVDDVSDSSFAVYTDAAIDFTDTEHRLGARGAGAQSKFDGDLADFWLDFGTYVDLSVLANRRKFIGENAINSVDLGSDGSSPTGTSPIIFFSGPTASWHTNKGTGGGFTENGALTDATTDPPVADPTVTGQAAFGGSSTLQASAIATLSGSASLPASSSLSVSGGKAVYGSWQGAGEGFLSSASQLVLSGSAALEGDSSLGAAAGVTRSGNVILQGTSRLSATAKGFFFKPVRGRPLHAIHTHRPRG